jgi:hypothetical protein
MSNEKESKKSALIWVLIGVIILSVVVVLYATFPNDFRIAEELQSRGFEVHYDGQYEMIWQHPAYFIWGHPTEIVVYDQILTSDDSRLICQLRDLEQLGFIRSDVSGLDWDEIGHCRELSGLGFYEVKGFSTSEIQKLAACPIVYLTLVNVRLSDSDLENIMGLKQLGWLWVDKSIGITDASFEYLEKIATLKYLHISKTSVTEEGVNEFKKKRPYVSVISNFSVLSDFE